jgi:hypothetical protein
MLMPRWVLKWNFRSPATLMKQSVCEPQPFGALALVEAKPSAPVAVLTLEVQTERRKLHCNLVTTGVTNGFERRI